tara:strand:+ start:2063 stop:3223 length:1161 start_codon:yes stop_codon:yes gene_type:complete
MIGGELLSEGGYGCIFRPEISCDGKSLEDTDYVSKIQLYDKSAKKELELGKIIQTIKGFRNRFVPVMSHCFIDVSRIETKDKNDCSILKKKSDNKFILFKILYIEGSTFINFMVKNQNSKQIVNNIIHSYNYLLKSIKMLIDKKLVHYDIKGDNILFNEKMKLPSIIDFGLGLNIDKINMKNLENYFYVFAPEYYIWSLEIHYLSFLVKKKKKPTAIELEYLTREYILNNVALKSNFSPNFLENYKKLCMKQLIAYNNLEYENAIKKILSYWKSWDNYSLSVLYLKIIYYLNPGGYTNNSFLSFFTEILLINISPDPTKRLSIVDTIHSFNEFIVDKDINKKNTFTEIVKLVRDNRDEISIRVERDQKNIKLITKKIEKYQDGWNI